MTIANYISDMPQRLSNKSIATARLDCLVLLEDATGNNRSWLLAHPEHELTDEQVTQLQQQITRRANHEPLAYIRGKSEFFGREFLVNAHTLEPRPETETMIEQLLMLVDSGEWIVDSKNQNDKYQMKNEKLTIVDVGTGSGCIGITAKLELPKSQVVAIDIDQKSIKTARRNAQKLNADVTFLQGNLLLPILENENWKMNIEQNRTIMLANLPYVPTKYELNSAAKFEPKHAIFGGEDGLDLYRNLYYQIATKLQFDSRPQYIFTESLPIQHAALAKIAASAGYSLHKSNDFIQIFVQDK